MDYQDAVPPSAEAAAPENLVILPAGVVYTPDTVTGDDDITFPPLIFFAAAASDKEDHGTYTVRFDKKVRDTETAGIAPVDNAVNTYPVTDPNSPVKGVLYQVSLSFLNPDLTTTPVDRSMYSISGLNGIQKGRKSVTFDLILNPDTFQYPAGSPNSVNVLIIVTRKNTDAAQTVTTKVLAIRVHKSGF